MIDELEHILQYYFKDRELLQEALTHPSISQQKGAYRQTLFNYERLEFLGDGVLGLVIAELLLKKYPTEREGALAKRQAALVRGEAVAEVAEQLKIGQYIYMAQGEESMGGRNNASNIENALEAIIGAIYQDGGIDAARAFISRHWDNQLEQMTEPPKDPKTTLQEWSQSKGLPIPEYTTLTTRGPSHQPLFEVQVSITGFAPITAEGASKKKAEKDAAKKMLDIVHGQ